MQRSRFFSIASLVFVAAASFAFATWDTGRALGHAIAATVRKGVDWAISRIQPSLSKLEAKPAARPHVALVQARAFFARQIKREMPRITPYWRMCPSI